MPQASLLPNSAIASLVCFLQVAEGDDVAVGLDRVEDAVGARVRLDQAMGAQVLVDEQRVERGGVEAGQEHVDHDDRSISRSFRRSERSL